MERTGLLPNLVLARKVPRIGLVAGTFEADGPPFWMLLSSATRRPRFLVVVLVVGVEVVAAAAACDWCEVPLVCSACALLLLDVL